MWTTPRKHTKKRETLRNANQNKTTRTAGYKKMYGKKNQRKHSELKEPDEMLNKTKTFNNNSSIEEGQRKIPKMKHSDRNGTLRKPLCEEQSLTKC